MQRAKLEDRKASPGTTVKRKPDYGIESRGSIRTLLIVGTLATSVGAFFPSLTVSGFRLYLIGPTLLAIGVLSLMIAASMIAYSLRGKFNVRDRMLRIIDWKGDEAVLDVGTGLGLLVIGAANRIKTGTAFGIDLWEDSAGHSMENTLRNVSIEGVEDRVEIRNDDPRSIGFIDNSFDVVLSSSYIHTIEGKEERDATCLEIARVLRRGGTAIIADHTNINEYAKAFVKAGLMVEKPSSIILTAYTPMALLVARKL